MASPIPPIIPPPTPLPATKTPLPPLGAWPPLTFIILSAVGFLGRLSYEMVRSPITALYAKHLGAPTAVIGLIVAAVTVTGIVVKLPAGALADILGFKRIMVSGLVVKATGPWLYLIAHSWQVLLAVRFYHGFSTALYAPAASALVAKRYPKERAHRLGLYSAAENAGVVLGPVVGAAILAAYSFNIAFIISGVIGTLAFLLVMRIPRDAPAAASGPRPTAGAVTRQLVQGVREIVSDNTIRLTSLIEGTLYMGVGSLQAYLPLYALTVNISVARMGLLFGGQGIASILSRPAMGTLSDRVGRRPIIAIGVLLCAATLAIMPQFAGFVPLLLLNVLFGLGTGMVTPSTTAMIGDRVKAGNFGSAMGAFGSLWDAGHAGGPIIAGFLIAAFGYQVSFLAIAITIGAALAVFIVGTRQTALA